MRKQETLQWLDRCIELARHAGPMTQDEKREHLARVAQEIHRAEAARNQTQQLPLGERK